MWKAWLLKKCFTSRVEVLNFQLKSNLFDMAHTLLQLKRRPACFRLETTGLDFNKANLFWIRKKNCKRKFSFQHPLLIFTPLAACRIMPSGTLTEVIQSQFIWDFIQSQFWLKSFFCYPGVVNFNNTLWAAFLKISFCQKNYKHKL